MALMQATKESIWLQRLLLDLGARKHIAEVNKIIVDNPEAIALAKNTEYHPRTKHIEIQYHFIRHISRVERLPYITAPPTK